MTRPAERRILKILKVMGGGVGGGGGVRWKSALQGGGRGRGSS